MSLSQVYVIEIRELIGIQKCLTHWRMIAIFGYYCMSYIYNVLPSFNEKYFEEIWKDRVHGLLSIEMTY